MKIYGSKTFFIGLVVLMLIGLFALPPDQATAMYPDPSKSITFIIPVSVGGGYDFYTRLLAPFLSDELDVRIKIRNVPGGKWLTRIRMPVSSANFCSSNFHDRER